MNYKIGQVVWTDPMFFGCDGEFTQAEIVFYQGSGWYMTRMLSTGIRKLIHQDYIDNA